MQKCQHVPFDLPREGRFWGWIFCDKSWTNLRGWALGAPWPLRRIRLQCHNTWPWECQLKREFLNESWSSRKTYLEIELKIKVQSSWSYHHELTCSVKVLYNLQNLNFFIALQPKLHFFAKTPTLLSIAWQSKSYKMVLSDHALELSTRSTNDVTPDGELNLSAIKSVKIAA